MPSSPEVAGNKALLKLGERIREARRATGLSQEQLALQADIDRSFMGQVERGQRNISVLTLLRMARVLDVNLGSLCEDLGGVGVDATLAEGVTPYRVKKAKGMAGRARGARKG